MSFLFTALITLFSQWKYRFIVLGASVIFFLVPILIPVWFVPSDTLSFELHLMQPEQYALLILFAIFSGILLTLNLFLLQQRMAVSSSTGIIAAFLGSILLTSCGCSIGFLLGIVGLSIGSTSFILANQFYIISIAFLITLAGIYFSARKVAGICATCKVEIPSH